MAARRLQRHVSRAGAQPAVAESAQGDLDDLRAEAAALVKALLEPSPKEGRLGPGEDKFRVFGEAVAPEEWRQAPADGHEEINAWQGFGSSDEVTVEKPTSHLSEGTGNESQEKQAQNLGSRKAVTAVAHARGPRAATEGVGRDRWKRGSKRVKKEEGKGREASKRLMEARDPQQYSQILAEYEGQLTGPDMCTLLKSQRDLSRALQIWEWLKTQQGFEVRYVFNAMLIFASQPLNPEVLDALVKDGRTMGVQFNSTTYVILINAYGKARKWMDAFAYYQEMCRNPEANSSVEPYNAMINAFSLVRKPGDAARVVKELKGAGLAPDDITYNTLIAAFGRAGRVAEAAECMEQMQAEGITPNDYTYNTMLNAYGKAGLRDEALRLVSQMQSVGYAPSDITYNTLLDMHILADAPEEALALVKEMEAKQVQFTVRTHNILIRAYGKLDDLDGALEIFKKLKRGHLAIDRSTYNVMVHLYASSGRMGDAEQIIIEMRRAGLQPCTILWNSLINAHAKAGQYEDAAAIFQRMESEGSPPDQGTFSVMIHVYFYLDLVEPAIALFKRLKQLIRTPRSAVYVTMLALYDRAGMVKEAVSLFKEMLSSNRGADDQSYARMIDMLAWSGRWPEAEALFQAAKADLRASPRVYGALINAYERAGEFEAASAVFREMQEQGIEPTDAIVGLVAQALGRTGHVKDVKGVFEEFQRKSPVGTISPATYSQVLSVYGRAELFKAAENVFKAALRAGCADTRVYNAMVDAYCRSGLFEEAVGIVRLMEERNLGPNGVTFRTLVVRSAESGRYAEAGGWLDIAMEKGYRPDASTHNKVLSGYARTLQVEAAEKVFEGMCKAQGLAAPTAVTYNTMITLYGKVGNYEIAARVLRRMREAGVEPTEVTHKVLTSVFRHGNERKDFDEDLEGSMSMEASQA